MLIFKTVLIQSCFWACLLLKHAYFQNGAYYRASMFGRFENNGDKSENYFFKLRSFLSRSKKGNEKFFLQIY